MLTNPTMHKLVALSLTGMAAALKEQLERADYGALAFEDRLGLLVDREATERENRRLERNLKAAKLRTSACIEDLDFHHPRGLDRAQILSLADAQWVGAHRNVLIVGPTGVGKTYLACALAHAAL
ncbi:MAG TPA: ATP-binding protein, partial [Candidatus Dormibacteraeota bacterium]|nr:ATP-binding protein [Candidatus Dormibacteraeota bacterium]